MTSKQIISILWIIDKITGIFPGFFIFIGMKKVIRIKESEWPSFKKEIREDLFLKKNKEDSSLHVFSDKEQKWARYQETSALAKEFRKLGFEYKGELGHWVGDYSKFSEINSFIKSHNKVRKIIEDLEALEDFIAETNAGDQTGKSVIMGKLDSYINDLANATDQAAMDAAIRNYLTFYSRFHNYSLTNSFLIYLQKKDAKRVAGYNTWKKNNRGVKKGATVIYIWFPMNIKVNTEVDTTGVDFSGVDDAVKKGTTVTKFSLGVVYDISDTYPLNDKGNVPETPKWFAENEKSEVADELIVRLNKFAEALKIKVTKNDAKGGEKGFSAGEHINLSSDIEGVAEASTFIHELAHELLHWKIKSPFYIDDPAVQTAEMRELQAESVSYAVMKYFELPVTQHPTYLALWKANKEKIITNLNVIVKCSKFIIDGVEAADEKDSE